jgi:hypothetical protein
LQAVGTGTGHPCERKLLFEGRLGKCDVGFMSTSNEKNKKRIPLVLTRGRKTGKGKK